MYNMSKKQCNFGGLPAANRLACLADSVEVHIRTSSDRDARRRRRPCRCAIHHDAARARCCLWQCWWCLGVLCWLDAWWQCRLMNLTEFGRHRRLQCHEAGMQCIEQPLDLGRRLACTSGFVTVDWTPSSTVEYMAMCWLTAATCSFVKCLPGSGCATARRCSSTSTSASSSADCASSAAPRLAARS